MESNWRTTSWTSPHALDGERTGRSPSGGCSSRNRTDARDRSGSRRSRHTARSFSSVDDSLVVTHPYHPLAGKRVPVLIERRYRSLGHVYICDGGPLGPFTLPEDVTDRGRAPGESPVDAEVLADLAAIVLALKKVLTPRDVEE